MKAASNGLPFYGPTDVVEPISHPRRFRRLLERALRASYQGSGGRTYG
jgi:hypothetical protein